ncbi:MAG: chain length-determining protein [Gammaproteobacteria bacterium]|nr:chain length-determining protein [Gammaproteobacteria bacterium]
MNEQLKQALSIGYLFWRKRWLVLWVVMGISMVGWPVVHFMPNVYESKVKIYLDTQSVLGPLLEGLAVDGQGSSEEQLDLARRTLLSRTNLEIVARLVDLDLRANSPEEFERIIVDLRNKIKINGSERENIYVISYSDKDPRLAKRVVESLLETFMNSMLKSSRGDAELAHKFLETQISVYEKKLIEAESALKTFKRENIGLMPTEAGGYFRQLEGAENNLSRARLDLREATRRRDDLRTELDQEKSVIESRSQHSMIAVAETPLEQRLSAMRMRLDELTFNYTESHPDILVLRENIALLESQVAASKAAAKEGQSVSVAMYTADPVYQELRVELSRVEAEVSGLRVRVAEYSRHVNKFKEHVDTIPMVEAELAKLNRDYDVNKSNYEALVSRREAAMISREAELSSDQVHVRVIDPPREPVIPVGPNRPLLITAVMLGGLAFICGIIFLDAQLRPQFNSVQSLRAVTGLPVLGGVSLFKTPAQLRTRKVKMFTFFTLVALFLLVYFMVIAFEAGLLLAAMVYLNISS